MYQQGPFYHGPNNQPPYYNQPPSKPPSNGPLPVEQAVKQLFRQYCRVLTSPGRAIFAQEIPKAAWNIIWVQVILLAILLILPTTGIFGFIVPILLAILFAIFSSKSTFPMSAGIFGLRGLLALSMSPLMLVPLSFFIPLIIQYLAAKMLGGRGKLVQHGYARALITMPVLLLSTVIALFPILGEIILLPLQIYAIVLSILMIMEVHHIDGVKATIAFFSPLIVMVLLAIIVYLSAICLMLFTLMKM